MDSAAYQRKYRADNPDYVERHKASQKKRARGKHVWIADYLRKHPCVDCGETDIVVLEFDHVRGDQRRDVTGLSTLSLAKIIEEINKCEVVCSNCHTRRTARRANTIRWQLSQIPSIIQ